MAIKFLHTSDWQMGMKALQVGEKAKELRAKRFVTAAQVVILAKNELVDFVIIAGDLFEHHDVDDTVVNKTVAILNSFAPIPVFIIPGNHDPSIPGGVWDRQSWKRVGTHVRLLTESIEITSFKNVALYPSPLKQKQSNIDPTAWIPARGLNDNRIRIGIAHGSLDVLPGQANFPIAANRVNDTGLDYLALGDWHSYYKNGKAVYSGTFEQTSFSERDPGDVVIVEIYTAGTEPSISRKRVGQLHWNEHIPTIHDSTDVEQLRDSIARSGPLDEQIIRVLPNIDSDVTMAVLSDLIALRNEIIEESFFIDWSEESVTSQINVKVSIPEGIISNVDSDLSTILEGNIPAGLGRELASSDIQIVSEAKLLLRRLVMEGQR